MSIAPGALTVVTLNFDLDNSGSDLGLFNSNSFSSSTAMQSFVQWGTSADVGRSDVAFAKGIWGRTNSTTYDFVATAGTGSTLQFDGSGTDASNFTNGTASIGSANIPEPSGLALLSLGVIPLMKRKR